MKDEVRNTRWVRDSIKGKDTFLRLLDVKNFCPLGIQEKTFNLRSTLLALLCTKALSLYRSLLIDRQDAYQTNRQLRDRLFRLSCQLTTDKQL